MSKKMNKSADTETVVTTPESVEEENSLTPSSPTPPSTLAQFLSADDILDSCGPPIVFEVPELPRNGKPGIVYIRRPSFASMNAFWSRRRGEENEMTDSGPSDDSNKDRTTTRADDMSALIGFLIVSEDGTRLFSDEQVSRIKEARADVFQRLQNGVSSIVQPVMDGINEVLGNPFVAKEEPN